MEALFSLIFASLTIDFPTGDEGGGIPSTSQKVAHSLNLADSPQQKKLQ